MNKEEEEVKSIIISLENWKILMKYRIELNCSSVDDLITRLLKVISIEDLT